MTSVIAAIGIDAAEPEVVAAFWCEVLGWRVVERADDFISIGAPDGSPPTIDVALVPEPKTVKNRVHLDLRASDVARADELARLEALGAVRVDVGQDPSGTWTVLTDPEGNEFCLLLRMVSELADS